MALKRYSRMGQEMVEDAKGGWVQFADAEKLQRETVLEVVGVLESSLREVFAEIAQECKK